MRSAKWTIFCEQFALINGQLFVPKSLLKVHHSVKWLITAPNTELTPIDFNRNLEISNE